MKNIMSTKNLCRLLPRSIGLLTFCLSTLAWSVAEGTPILIDVGSAPNITTHVSATFNDLNGTALQGQTLSLDFLFANGHFARLFSVTNPQFGILITLNISGSGDVGFLDGTGFLLDQNGNALGAPEALGSISGPDSLTVGLFPLRSGQFSTPLDFYGVHTDLLLPNSPFTITGGEFQLVSAGAGSRDVFGIGPGVPTDIVPDSGSTLILFSLVLLGLIAGRGQISMFYCTLAKGTS
jgi:hypothetical protein